jgi:hypothetical protein
MISPDSGSVAGSAAQTPNHARIVFESETCRNVLVPERVQLLDYLGAELLSRFS